MTSSPDIASSLSRKIRAIEQKGTGRNDSRLAATPTLSSGWAEVDAAIGGGLPRGLHEWFGLAAGSSSNGGQTSEYSRQQKQWRPLVAVAIHFVSRVLDGGEPGRWAIWIGRRCFPYPAVLVRRFGNGCEKGFSNSGFRLSPCPLPSRERGFQSGPNTDLLLQQSLFVAPRNPADRLWAIDLALRSPAVSIVVADGSDLDMAATRRIQLVAKNHESQAFFIRPPWEQGEPSAAYSRWLMRSEPAINRFCLKTPSPSQGEGWGEGRTRANHPSPDLSPQGERGLPSKRINPTWMMELLRCKGVHWGTMAKTWRLEWDRVECTLRTSSALADSAGAAPTTANAGRGDRPRRRLASG